MKNIKKLIAVFIALFVLVGCQENKPAPTNEAGEPVVQEMAGKDLDPILADNKKKEDYLVIDVRPKEQYDEGHVRHAIHIPTDDIENQLARIESYKDKAVVTICNTGNQSGKAADKLIDLGFTNVSNAEGVKDFEYSVMTKVGSILADDIQKMAKDSQGEYFIIDARKAEDYDKGHLEGAVNITIDNVEEKINEVPKDKTVLAYCYTGNQSLQVLETLSENGFEDLWNSLDGTKEYDGFELVTE